MSNIKVKSLDDDNMEITIDGSEHTLKLRDFDEIVMNVFIQQKRDYEEKILTSNDYKSTQESITAIRVLSETLEKITKALFLKCLVDTYNHYQTEVNEELDINNISELFDFMGIKEG